MIDITPLVNKALPGESAEGMAFVYVPHTTAAVTVNENADPAVQSDMLRHLQTLIPEHTGFEHTEGNSDGHIKSSLIGITAAVPVVGGRLALGRWQGIFFCEFDGPRERQVFVQVLAAKES